MMDINNVTIILSELGEDFSLVDLYKYILRFR